MIVLAIDTTNPEGGVAVCHDHQVASLVRNELPANTYSVSLFQMTEKALGEAGIRLSDVNLFAAANGPGSFTGIRVGLAAVQGWSKAFDRPARGVSVLEAMIETAQPQTNLAIALLDARRGEFYVNKFQRVQVESPGAEAYQPIDRGWLLTPSAIREWVEKMPSAETASLTWIVRGSDLSAKKLRDTLALTGEWQALSEPLMAAIARIGQRITTEKPEQGAPLDAFYIRPSDAELKWKG